MRQEESWSKNTRDLGPVELFLNITGLQIGMVRACLSFTG